MAKAKKGIEVASDGGIELKKMGTAQKRKSINGPMLKGNKGN